MFFANFSTADISKACGVSRQAVNQRSKRYGWSRLRADIRSKLSPPKPTEKTPEAKAPVCVRASVGDSPALASVVPRRPGPCDLSVSYEEEEPVGTVLDDAEFALVKNEAEFHTVCVDKAFPVQGCFCYPCEKRRSLDNCGSLSFGDLERRRAFLNSTRAPAITSACALPEPRAPGHVALMDGEPDREIALLDRRQQERREEARRTASDTPERPAA